MTVVLTNELMRKIFPKMKPSLVQIFVNKQSAMAEILASPKRLALCFANLVPETASFNDAIVHNLTENTNYTPKNVVSNWPHRYPSVAAVQAHFGTGPDWRKRMFNEIYGYEADGHTPRMGNRPGTDDGWTYIGRGAPQVTGRDGYKKVGDLIGVDLVSNPQLCASEELQPEIIAAFWKWKKLTPLADSGDAGSIVEARRRWNGGRIGLSEVQAAYPRFLSIITNYNPTTAAPESVVVAPTARVDENLKMLQQHLIEFGYHEVGKDDGQLGGRTNGAIQAFFTDRGLPLSEAKYPSSMFENEVSKAFKEDWHRPIAPGRAFATAEDIKSNVGSVAPTQKAGFLAKIGAWFGGVTATGKAAFLLAPDLNDQSYSYVSFIKSMWNEIPDWVFPVTIMIVAIIIVRQTTRAKDETVAAYQQGKIN